MGLLILLGSFAWSLLELRYISYSCHADRQLMDMLLRRLLPHQPWHQLRMWSKNPRLSQYTRLPIHLRTQIIQNNRLSKVSRLRRLQVMRSATHTTDTTDTTHRKIRTPAHSMNTLRSRAPTQYRPSTTKTILLINRNTLTTPMKHIMEEPIHTIRRFHHLLIAAQRIKTFQALTRVSPL